MPDIYCSHCGEPWDIAELHEVSTVSPEYTSSVLGTHTLSFSQAARLFPAMGCGLWTDRMYGGPIEPCRAKCVNADAATRAKRLHEAFNHPDEWI